MTTFIKVLSHRIAYDVIEMPTADWLVACWACRQVETVSKALAGVWKLFFGLLQRFEN